MPVRSGSAEWKGGLRDGAGRMRLGADGAEVPFTRASHDEVGPGSNPEELVGAALAGSYSFYLASSLTRVGHPPLRIVTTAKVHVGEGPRIEGIELDTLAEVPDLDEGTFMEHAAVAKRGCAVSQALAGAEITLSATLIGG